jgi:hypothetical protein
MALVKATITAENTRESLEVMFNPEEYSLNRDNNFASQAIPGLGSPILQFAHGNLRTLDMELLFDTYEVKQDAQRDVRIQTQRLIKFMEIDSALHAPPILQVAWASLHFRCVLTKAAQKFILFLGQPVYALSIVLFSMLLFSGLGSFISSWLLTSKLDRNIRLACLLISILIIAYVGFLPAVLYTYVSLPTLHKALIVVVLLFPLSFWMGMPMPLGIHRLKTRSAAMVPWAWGVNGSASVLGSIATVLIAANFGFNQALLAAASFYALGAVLISSRD